MKPFNSILFILSIALALATLLPSCSEKPKGPAEEIGEAIDDITDSRPGEKVKDAVEDVEDALKDTVN